jgi:hypothetical protein
MDLVLRYPVKRRPGEKELSGAQAVSGVEFGLRVSVFAASRPLATIRSRD